MMKEKKPESTFVLTQSNKQKACNRCSSCVIGKFLEMGFFPGSFMSIKESYNGLQKLNIVDKNKSFEKTIAIRNEDLDKLLSENLECSLSFSVC